MKSLQLVTPAKPCIFHCPYCVSKTRNLTFSNVLEENLPQYKKRLKKVLKENPELKTIVITGTNDPTQSSDEVLKIIAIIRRERPEIQIELQTRKHRNNGLLAEKVDVIAYSIDRFEDLGKTDIISGVINRYTIILTASFNGKSFKDEILPRIPSAVSQLTFKVLYSGVGNTDKDILSSEAKTVINWIINNSLSDKDLQSLRKEINSFSDSKYSIFFDESCMVATERYMVLREDGFIYSSWDAKDKEE